MFLLTCVPASHRLMLGSVDLQFMRILGVVAVLRMLLRGQIQAARWCRFDMLVGLFAFLPVVAAVPRGAGDAIMNLAGQGFDLVSMYLIGRLFIRDRRDWEAFAISGLVISIPVLVSFAVEKTTGRNFFSVFGGVPEYTPIREGRLRASGAFAHPITAGVWWAAMLPIFVSMARTLRSQLAGVSIAFLGGGVSLVLAVLTASSTPIGGVFFGLLLWAVFPIRWSMVRMRWYLIVGLVGLHFVAKSGLHGLLFTRFSFVAGSTGQHRFRLIDAAISRMPEWLFVGTRSTYHWGWGLDDVTCQYVAAAVEGGIIQLALLVLLLWGAISAAWSVGATPAAAPWQKWTSWGLVVSLAVHGVCFLALTYFGEVVFLWAFSMGAAISLRETYVVRVGQRSAAHSALGGGRPGEGHQALRGPVRVVIGGEVRRHQGKVV